MAKQTDETKVPHVPKDLYALVQKLMGVKPDGSTYPFPRAAVCANGTESQQVIAEYLPMRKSKSTGKEAMQFDSAVSAQLAKDSKLTQAERSELSAAIAVAEDVTSDDWEDVKQ
jgi:hypothetical protein